MTASVIDVGDLHVRYPGAAQEAVAGISFDVRSGEIFGLLGPNGAGKSTTQRVLTRLLRTYQGNAAVFGRELEAWGADYYERIGVSFELPAHYGRLTARENLAAFAALYRHPVDRPDELLERLGLADAADRQLRTFSKGMQMRFNFARALVNQPELLFLDEPTSGLDPVHAALVRRLIRAEAEAGRTILLTTHDMPTVDELCDRVAFVVDGRIVALDTPRNFKLRHGSGAVQVEYRANGTPLLARAEFPSSELGRNETFLALLREGRVETIHSREASLDQVFIELTGRQL
jgi:fluoroquinolone transport system ATP-binding protein